MRVGALSIALGGTIFACSGGGGSNGQPAVCTNVPSCGGSVVGTWTVANLCGPGANQTLTPLVADCPSSSSTVTRSATGTLTFNADSTYAFALIGITGGTEHLPNDPKTCLSGASCAQIERSFLQDGSGVVAIGLVPTSGTKYSSASCADDGSSCNCALVLVPRMTTETGTYTVSGSTLETTPTGGAALLSSQYCVSGTQISIAPSAPTAQTLIFIANKT